jgi:hypothetical protein
MLTITVLWTTLNLSTTIPPHRSEVSFLSAQPFSIPWNDPVNKGDSPLTVVEETI